VITVNPNQSPTAVAVVDESLVIVGETVNFDGSGSSDSDGSIISYEWDFDASDGIQIDATGDITSNTYAIAGTYTVTLTVTDNGVATATAEVVITVNPNQPPTAHVESIVMSSEKIKLRGWYVSATAEITIVDSNGVLVSGLDVSGEWSGLANHSSSGTTGENGQVTFASTAVKNTNGELTFTITGIEKDELIYEISGSVSGSVPVVK
ncbi:MAG: PKD domain-containing protein, partial [Candidatus Pacebacteria bacterium]|nr:PKD domain-containing protein [Candidatus Paceibacterota bacterium]